MFVATTDCALNADKYDKASSDCPAYQRAADICQHDTQTKCVDVITDDRSYSRLKKLFSTDSKAVETEQIQTTDVGIQYHLQDTYQTLIKNDDVSLLYAGIPISSQQNLFKDLEPFENSAFVKTNLEA